MTTPNILPYLADMFPDTVIIESFVSETDKGVRTYDTANPRSYAAFVYGKIRMIRTMDGQEKISNVTVVLATTETVTTKDRYTLPTRFQPNQPIALNVHFHTDENGAHHSTIYF